MTLVDMIEDLVGQGLLPRIWTTQHLLACAPLAAAFSKTTLRTDPSNRSSSPCNSVHGVHVKPGKPSPYVRFQPAATMGKALWYCLREHYLPEVDAEVYQGPLAESTPVTARPAGEPRHAWRETREQLAVLERQGGVTPETLQQRETQAYRKFLQQAATRTDFDLINRQTGESAPLLVYHDHVLVDSSDPEILAKVQFLNVWRSSGRQHDEPIEELLSYHASTGANGYASVALIKRMPSPSPASRALGAPVMTDETAFRETFAEALARIETYVSETPLLGRHGWTEQFAGYQWGGDWRVGVASRLANAEAMSAFLRDDRTFASVSAQIVNQWGGIAQKMSPSYEGPVRETLAQLMAAPDRLVETGMCGKRIASVSKLYAAASLEQWVIYDSRVAAALTFLLQTVGFKQQLGGCFGALAAKSPHLMRVLPDYPRIWASSGKLAFRSFVHASWVCRALAERLSVKGVPLPDGEAGEWKAYHVEMVLFMLGHDLRALPAH